NWRGFGFSAGYYIFEPKFIKIRKYIQDKIPSLKNEKNKQKFRVGCLAVAKYLIEEKSAPPYINQNNWEQVIQNYFEYRFDELTKYGGCPMILEQNDRDLLELSYEVKDFNEKKVKDLKSLERYKTENNTYNCNNNQSCIKKLSEYNVWIKEMEHRFENKKSLIEKNLQNQQGKFKFSVPLSDLLIPKTFKELPESVNSHRMEHEKSLRKEKEENIPQMESQNSPEGSSKPQDEGSQKTESLTPLQVPPLDTLPIQMPSDPITTEIQVRESEHKQVPDFKGSEIHISTTPTFTLGNPYITTLEVPQDQKTTQLHNKLPIIKPYSHQPTISIILCITNYALLYLFKKTKKIKTRQVKLLRILPPSFLKQTSELFTNDHLEESIHDNKETIKKIKINEHNMNNYISPLKLKNNKYKTIIEVHMEVLKEYRNYNWEYEKDEFLEICLELFTKGEHGPYTNFTNNELITENTKSISYKEKQKILWKKWIEKHKKLSEKLKKVDWFNNLKNDWKRELANLKKKELKKNPSDKIQNIPFLHREMDIWRQWIAKKTMIIKQYIEPDLFKHVSYELYNISEEYKNDGSKDDFPLINIGDIANKECYQELYKHIKTKLLTKLCILVFMSVLEDCKKEDNLENRESYLDNSITKFKKKEKLENKTEDIENISAVNRDVLKHKENRSYTTNDRFTKEIDNWIKVDKT
ncbi:STP1 protein, partial [Plasmodium malariae]